jgi:RHH-type rel operon transcriptional repressor/antitoxin RelB
MYYMISLRLEPALEKRLNALAKKTGRTKSFYLRKAITEYLEDREDILMAEQVLARKERTYSTKEIREMLGLDH